MSEYDVLQQKLIELQEELANLRRSEYIARAGKAQAVDTQFPDALLPLPFDGGVAYEQDFSVNLFGHKLQRPTTASGGIIGRPGRFGKAVQLAEGTTNLICNPLCKASGSWSLSFYGGGSGSMSYVSDPECLGGERIRAEFVNNGNNTQLRAGAVTLTPSVPHTVSFRVRGSGTFSVQWVVFQGAPPYTIYWSQYFDASPEWTVHTYTATMPASVSNAMAMLRIYATGSGWFDIDWTQLEQKAYATPVAEGDMGPGHAWTGTAHASTSTRSASYLRYSSAGSLHKEQGSVSLWAKVVANPVATRYAFYHYATDSRVYIQHSDGEWRGALATTFQPAGTSAPVNYGQWDHLVLTWDGSQGILYVNGAPTTPFAYAGLSALSDIRVGHGGSSNQEVNGYLDDLLILDRALTAPEVRALYAAGQAGLGVLCPPQSWQPLVGAGAPTWGFAGMTYIDTTNNRWYVNVGGTWRYVGLT